MGELSIASFKIDAGDKVYSLRPVMRTLSRNDKGDHHRYTMEDVMRLKGGLILGEGDTGKTSYVKIFKKYVADEALVKVIWIRKNEHLTRDTIEESISKLKEQAAKSDKLPIIIFDGLDENDVHARDIVDVCDEEDKCAIWVTSRPCEGASRLMLHSRFEKPFSLNDLSYRDVETMVSDIDFDLRDFYRSLRAAGLYSFTRKPGGLVLMLRKYLTRGIKRSSRLEMMEEIAKDFACEMRDGQAIGPKDELYSPQERLEAARWIAVQLFLSGKNSLWVQGTGATPKNALAFNDLCLGKYDRKLLIESTNSRLFEPLSVNRLRLTYSDMSSFLPAKWLAENKSTSEILQMLPSNGAYISDETAKVMSWAGQYKPELCLPMLAKKPAFFLGCHEAIRIFGVESFFKLTIADPLQHTRDEAFLLLNGFEEFRDCCRKYVEQGCLITHEDCDEDNRLNLSARMWSSSSTNYAADYKILTDIFFNCRNNFLKFSLAFNIGNLFNKDKDNIKKTSNYQKIRQYVIGNGPLDKHNEEKVYMIDLADLSRTEALKIFAKPYNFRFLGYSRQQLREVGDRYNIAWLQNIETDAERLSRMRMSKKETARSQIINFSELMTDDIISKLKKLLNEKNDDVDLEYKYERELLDRLNSDTIELIRVAFRDSTEHSARYFLERAETQYAEKIHKVNLDRKRLQDFLLSEASSPAPSGQNEDEVLSDWEWLVSQKAIIGGRFEVSYDAETNKLTITNYKIPANKKIKPYTKIKKQLQREIVAKLIRHFAGHPGKWLDCSDDDISQLFKNGEYKRFRDNEIENEMAANNTYTGNRRIYTNDDFVKRFDELK